MKQVADIAKELGINAANLVGPIVAKTITATPIIGLIFSTCAAVYEIALTENANQEKCKRAAIRCKGIETIIRICAHEYAHLDRKNAFTQDHIEVLNRLNEHVQRLKELAETYSKQSKVKRVLGGVSFHKEYDKINIDVTNAIDILQADLSTVTIAQNRNIKDQIRNINDYLENSKLNDMFATLEALQNKSDKSEANREEMEMKLLEEFSKNNRALKLQGMKIDGLKLLLEKHREMANAKSDQDKRILVTLLDSVQNQMMQMEKHSNKIGNAILNDTKDIKNLLRRKSDQEEAKHVIHKATVDNEILPEDVDFFNFEKFLGRGSFGKIYLFRYNGELHAGKCIETGGLSIPEQLKLYKSFQKEFAIMCTARSRRVIEVYGVITQIESKLIYG